MKHPAKPPAEDQHKDLIDEAVFKARMARRSVEEGQTTGIMRAMLMKALHRSNKKFKVTIVVLLVALTGMAGYAAWTIRALMREKTDIDTQIRQIEAQLQSGTLDSKRIDQLVDTLDGYQTEAKDLQRNLLYRLGVRTEEEDFVESEIKQLMQEFGAEEYSIPLEFKGQVRRFILHYQGPDRKHMEAALGRLRRDLETVRRYLAREKLPADLAYMVLVESAFISENSSSQGAAGYWQFTPATARSYGLAVDDDVDERLDLRKSTQAAGRYIRELILDFGSGSSVMLALAAYNVGPGAVKRAVRSVKDPIKQRNFWYLYRARALPVETREYIPKIIASIIIGRNPERFGFE
jgi:hypothetical protein